MKIAVMQPYFYPYIGYFNLIRDVDVFVFFTDVQYIRRGWINRNRIRNREKGWIYLTVPVKQHGRDTLIKDIQAAGGDWHWTHCETLKTTYRQAARHPLYAYYRSHKPDNLADYLCNSIEHVSRLLGAKTHFIRSDGMSCHGKGQERIIDICKSLKATEYHNLSGGTELYSSDEFAAHGIELKFQPPVTHPNKLSILDLMLGDGYT